ncbi:MAG: DNA-binding response regulator [uncultured Thermomicrobiales bacterium]|uniref:Phosphate regulon transcriptional regulatory protein PhoB n=1 Tax=uncultured Thermomicrobiales bacterium TaxID=1645740 RepID=A0A6J4V794_9BACT|nr:MAG: DNA-binding response regulator [uncultured Thermomicrobiales bacterium]
MERHPTVLVVDDEDDIVGLMRDFLEAGGYVVLTASDGPTALALLARQTVDCVLLDVMMPGLSGFDVLRRIRAGVSGRAPHGRTPGHTGTDQPGNRSEEDLPVIFLSARGEDGDKLRGLGLGADDYIVKSATAAEVVARVKAVLRRSRRGEPVQTAALLDFGRLTIDIGAREVCVGGQPVAFAAREFDLLQLLAEHPRQALTREFLYETLWGAYGDRHTLTVHISRLREKIEEDPTDPRYIVTVWGVGYRFEAERRA